MKRWLRQHPVIFFLPLHAALLFWNLGLWLPWLDEVISLRVVQLPYGEMLRIAEADVHPPLYYTLLYGWMRVPSGLDPVVQARALSVLMALAAMAAAGVLFRRWLDQAGQLQFLTLWTVSPCLLLYSRMCRSYSLQMLVSIVAVAALYRLAEKPTRRAAAGSAIAFILALYTHYVPGLALLAAAHIVLLRKRLGRQLLWL